MSKFCTQQGFCLLSGLQLLGLWAEAERSKRRARTLANKLLSHVGEIEGFDDVEGIFEMTESNTPNT